MSAIRGRCRTLGATAALVLVAGLFSSCGEDSNAGLSQERASNLRSALNEVEARVNDGDCTAAVQDADAFQQQVAALPSRVDKDLRSALEQSATRLESLVADQCEPAAAAEEAPAQEPSTTDENQGDQQDQGKKDKRPKKEKQPPDEQQPPDTGVTGATGEEGSTGATGESGGAFAP